ncbi:VOC family protein [Devosia sp. 2618]|uniref:2-oxoadipate dioxygenase/decarboxylase HglS n=1 Tax=Devosia sp. 2618 TaxID=3156454 RepID=UPI003393FBE0
MDDNFVSASTIRTMFSRAMSDMYRSEVPQYGTLMTLVRDVNAEVFSTHPEVLEQMKRAGEFDRLDIERHGAIRLGTAQELAEIARIFAVMGMEPVGYYDLSVAGVPVHSTAFRPVSESDLSQNPFRVFTSLLRLELIEDAGLRARAQAILDSRKIFTARALELTRQWETDGGFSIEHAEEFTREALETFRWHGKANVDEATYKALHDAHRLIADVVSFKGPHINHLTPRTLDIDAVQALMPERGIVPKESIEGPPRRRCPILLRQTSFKALEEPVVFIDDDQRVGGHTARFGEIEQRGAALTLKGRQLYDALLDRARKQTNEGAGQNYNSVLADVFSSFPDDYEEMRRQGLTYFRYTIAPNATLKGLVGLDLETLVAKGVIDTAPIIYEDFLPVSAAGIFQSNLQSQGGKDYGAISARSVFEAALGRSAHDEFSVYARIQQSSIDRCMDAIRSQTS